MSNIVLYFAIEIEQKGQELLWKGLETKSKRYRGGICLIFMEKMRFVSLGLGMTNKEWDWDWDLGKKTFRLGNRIWANIGLANGIYYLPQDPQSITSVLIAICETLHLHSVGSLNISKAE